MKILFFGDIVGKIGRRAVQKVLPEMKKKHEPDLVIANAENLAHGAGATMKTLQELMDAGVDLFTSGNHIWDKKEIFDIFSQPEDCPLIRPANYPPGVPGKGYKQLNIGIKPVFVINLLGRVFIRENMDCPFRAIDAILKDILTEGQNLPIVIVDFHAEATSEKMAFAWYVDGRVSAVLGTHTHVPTSDARILPQNTAFVSDIGMVGARDSVIGDEKEPIVKQFLTQLPQKFEIPESGLAQINAVLVEIDSETGKAVGIKRVDEDVEIP